MTDATEQTRRAVLGTIAAGAGLMSMSGETTAQAQGNTNTPNAKTFVLVHGAWHGGWCWRRVSDLLEKKGHKVFTPTMTGLGERSHLIDPKVNLATHITDIVNVIKWENLNDIVLVGHSYGGAIISGVGRSITTSDTSFNSAATRRGRPSITSSSIASNSSRCASVIGLSRAMR